MPLLSTWSDENVLHRQHGGYRQQEVPQSLGRQPGAGPGSALGAGGILPSAHPAGSLYLSYRHHTGEGDIDKSLQELRKRLSRDSHEELPILYVVGSLCS